MSDMLVKLYNLPELEQEINKLRDAGIAIRRAIAPEMHVVVNWVRDIFGEGWASECQVTFSNHPVSCYIAIENKSIIGFACYDSTCKNFFGPTGVTEKCRGKGVGKTLLYACLHSMSVDGYAYGIIGSAGPKEFYSRTVGAIEIEGSKPGIYKGMLTE